MTRLYGFVRLLLEKNCNAHLRIHANFAHDLRVLILLQSVFWLTLLAQTFTMATPADVLRFAHFEAAVQNAQRRAIESDRLARHAQNQCRMANAQADHARAEMRFADGRAHELERDLARFEEELEQASQDNWRLRDAAADV